ncbi:MAG: helix-turn-helix domain-containing protein, partial [Myxococcota bacterium]
RHFIAQYLRGVRPGGSAQTAAVVGERLETWLRSPEARTYHWPGNVRELQNVLRNLLLGLPPALKNATQVPEPSPGDELPGPIASCTATLTSASDWYISRVLRHCGGNYSQAAKVLDIDRSTVRRRSRARPEPATTE